VSVKAQDLNVMNMQTKDIRKVGGDGAAGFTLLDAIVVGWHREEHFQARQIVLDLPLPMRRKNKPRPAGLWLRRQLADGPMNHQS